MRKLFSLVMLFALVAAGCTTPTAPAAPSQPAAPAAQPTRAPQPTAAPAVQPITLQILDPGAAGSGRPAVVEWWGKTIQEKTNGRVQFKFHFAGALAGSNKSLEAINTGVADGGAVWPIYYPSNMPMALTFGAPFATPGDARKTLVLAHKLLKEDVLQKEFDKNNLVPLAPLGQMSYQVFVKKPFETVDGFKGIKIRAGGPPWPDIMKAVGGTNVSLSGPETYEAVQRGTVDGTLGAYDAWSNLRWYEVAPYALQWDVGAPVLGWLALNKDTWNKISPADRKIILDVSDMVPDQLAKQFDDEMAPNMKKMQAEGAKVVEISAAERAKLKALAVPAVKAWAASVEKERGAPVTAYLDRLLQLAEAANSGK
ncbi:MAG: TRAP transporter substrate-binding protein DctP [Dehalococcoidia bacterium]|nr:TRAP transporter substrate-binding protein DctP [Dehalococcoidia bacterium]